MLFVICGPGDFEINHQDYEQNGNINSNGQQNRMNCSYLNLLFPVAFSAFSFFKMFI